MKKILIKYSALLNTFYLYSKKNKIRFLLMLSGMAIGIFSITAIFIISDVGKKIINREVQSFGINRIWAYRSLTDFLNDQNTNPWTSNRQISNNDVKAMPRYCKDISRTAPSIWRSVPVTYKSKVHKGVKLIGTVPDWEFNYDEQIMTGRFLTPVDDINRNLICVLSYEAYKSIFKEDKALGYRLLVTNEYLNVVGILKKKNRPLLESMNLVSGNDEVIFIPLGLMQSQNWYNTTNVQQVDLQINNFNYSLRAANEIKNYLQIQHGKEPKFKVKTLYSQINIAKRIMRTVSIVLGIVALVSLLLAGTGIMNIMLASVSERSFEIGVRRAVGANRRDIIFQFIIESIIIGLIGGILGIAGGIAVYHLSQLWLGICRVTLLLPILIALLVSILTGLLAGFFPAQKAAAINPIDALRNI